MCTFGENVSGKPNDLPRYLCHKEVQALQIFCVEDEQPHNEGARWVQFNDHKYAPVLAPKEMFARYVPVSGDYYVVYADGYESFSPKRAFEEGYTRL